MTNAIRPHAHLHVDVHGAGEVPVVLLHGLGGSGRFWNTLLETLGAGHRFHAPDLLGFGRSPWPRSTYTVDDHLGALESSVFAQLARPAHLVGHSLGAILALERAARAPEATSSVTLLGLPYFDDDAAAARGIEDATAWGKLVLRAPALAWVTCCCLCRQRWFWGRVLPPVMPRLPRAIVEDSFKHTYQSMSTTLRRCILEARIDRAAERVARAGIPVRVLAGEHDPLATAARAQVFGARWGARVDVVAGGGHLFAIDAPAATSALLDAALATPARALCAAP